MKSVWVVNKNGGVHDVPDEWCDEDEVGVIRVNGNLGYRLATDAEVKAAQGNPPAESKTEAKKS